MKKTSKILITVLLMIIFAVCSSVVEYNDISSYDIVSGIAIDHNGSEWEVTCEIVLPSSNNDFGSMAQYVNGKDLTLENALKQAGLQSSNVLYTESVQLYLIGEGAVGQNELYDFLKSSECNLRAVAILAEVSASDVLKGEKESGERAKSLALADKLKSISDDNKLPLPHVINFIKNGGSLYINKDGIAERRAD